MGVFEMEAELMEEYYNDYTNNADNNDYDNNEEQSENEENTPLRESNYELYSILLQQIQNMYKIQRRKYTVELTSDENGEPQIENTIKNFFSAFNDYLVELHGQGDYNATVDTGEFHFSLRNEIRDQMASIDSNNEIDMVVTDTANHTLNMMNAVIEQSDGKDFSECNFTDKDGNPLKFDFSKDNYENTLEAIQYGIDHGTVNCILPNGKNFIAPSDGYTAKLDYYDSMNRSRLQYLADMERNTKEAFDNLSDSEKNNRIPDYISDERKQQYLNDVSESIGKYQDNYQKLADSYEKGNPYEEMIAKAKAQGDPNYNSRKQAAYNNANQYAANIRTNKTSKLEEKNKNNKQADSGTKIYQKVKKEDQRGVPYYIYTGKIDGEEAQLFSNIHVNKGKYTYELTDDDIKEIWYNRGSISFSDDKGIDHEVHMGSATDKKTGKTIYKTSIDGSIDDPTPEMNKKRAAYKAHNNEPINDEKDNEKEMDAIISKVKNMGDEICAEDVDDLDFGFKGIGA